MKKINACVIGAAGYTGGELVRLLINHPLINLSSAVSQSQQGKYLAEVFADLAGETELKFSSKPENNADVAFLCMPHGETKKYLDENPHLLKSKVVDLSRDYRLAPTPPSARENHSFVYGLPELNREKIKLADHIANPGCFATSIELGLLPLAHAQLLTDDVFVTAITGSTGAGQKPTDTTHLSWRQNNVSSYQEFVHPHNDEILQSIIQLQQKFKQQFLFIPQRGPFTRGIMATIMVKCDLAEEKVKKIYNDYYLNDPFTKVSERNIDLKMVVNTNKCFLYLKKQGDHLLILSIIDNLLKGASGQAVQNMNLMFGFDETEGLKLKASTY